jgi:hypothetical protein
MHPLCRRLSLLALLPTVALSGCHTASTSAHEEAGASVQGKVFGGQQPVTGATIQLYAVNTSTTGGPSTALLTTVVTTSDGSGTANANANAGNHENTLAAGGFDIPLPCPTGDALVYVTASGGNPGTDPPQNNPQILLLTALGSCDQLKANFKSGAVTNLAVNEVTTVGAVAALYPFMTGYSAVGSTPAQAPALSAAFNTVNEYVNDQTG